MPEILRKAQGCNHLGAIVRQDQFISHQPVIHILSASRPPHWARPLSQNIPRPLGSLLRLTSSRRSSFDQQAYAEGDQPAHLR